MFAVSPSAKERPDDADRLKKYPDKVRIVMGWFATVDLI
jgi:hypothetical protein